MKHEAVAASAEFSPDGQSVVTASLLTTARLWNGASGKSIGKPMEHESAVNSVASVVCGREIAHAAAHNKRMVPIVART